MKYNKGNRIKIPGEDLFSLKINSSYKNPLSGFVRAVGYEYTLVLVLTKVFYRVGKKKT